MGQEKNEIRRKPSKEDIVDFETAKEAQREAGTAGKERQGVLQYDAAVGSSS